MTDQLLDGRKLPIFIHSVIDDMADLTPNAACLYAPGTMPTRGGVAWPSTSIGDHCFSSISDNPQRGASPGAVGRTDAASLIVKTNRHRRGATTSANQLIDLPQGMPIGTPMPVAGGYVPIGTKDTPIEDTW